MKNPPIIIDEEDLARVNKHTWTVFYQDGKPRAMTKINRNETVLLHRFILNLKRGDGKQVDHINRNALDNRKENLRIVSARENALNSARSQYARIVERHGNRYRVRPSVNGKRMDLGSYPSEREALKVVERYRSEK